MASYYKAIIDEDVINCFNYFNSKLHNASSSFEIGYIYRHYQQSILELKLKEIAKAFVAENIQSELSAKGFNIKLWVFGYLKWSVITLFQNIQHIASELTNTDQRTVEDLLLLYFGEESSSTLYITENTEQVAIPVKNNEVITQSLVSLPTEKKALSPELTKILVKTTAFETVEYRLKEYSIVNEEGAFIKSKAHSHNKILSIVYKILIEKKYFRTTLPGDKKIIQPTRIQRLLDERYETNLTETFRKIRTADIEKAKAKYFWLENI